MLSKADYSIVEQQQLQCDIGPLMLFVPSYSLYIFASTGTLLMLHCQRSGTNWEWFA